MEVLAEKFMESDEKSEDTDFDDLEVDEFIPHNIIWTGILKEIEEIQSEIAVYKINKEDKKPNIPPNKETVYLDEQIFPLLLKILKLTLQAAHEMECIKVKCHQKSIFNGIDFIAQLLWNLNPKYPERQIKNENIYDMDWTQKYLKKNPRPVLPKSWIWTKEQAAIKIQAYMRGHFVRKLDEVQEMRQFWKILKNEKIMQNQAEQ